jgi:Domain of Unknown Function with PDB structure (DUF3857)/Domain of Unknown Function with PDB structure (DUF3858)
LTLPRMCSFCFLILLCAALFSTPARAGDEWQPLDPAELKMTSEPLAPGAPAIYLYRQVDRNDSGRAGHTEFNYVRIKILTEEGRKYANVEIPYSKAVTGISAIRARTIHADGSIVNFEGKILENTIVKSKTQKYLAKTFAIPDVQLGSIIEYHYTYDFEDYYIYWSKWMLSEELFTKKAVFSLKPYERFAVQWNWPAGLPKGTDPPMQGPDRIIRLTAVNVPAFQEEDHMPPENELKFLVNFVYSEDEFESDPVRFWKKYGEKQNKQTEKFVDRRKAMEQAVSQIISPSDSADTKLRKIYARCQQVKNLSFERNQDKAKEEKVKPNENVEDVWKRGVGSGHDVNLLFLALVRAAGFEAYYVRLSGRSEYFFNQKRMNAAQLDADTVLVKSEGKDLYLDPATKFAPYGLMPWPETGVAGLRIDKQGGTWIQTEIPESFACKVVRQADLKLGEEGGLEGQVKMTYTGLEALDSRLYQRFGDDTQRKEYLENALKDAIPATAEVELKNKPDWDTSDEKLVAEFNVKITGWASPAGRRVVLPLELFAGAQKHVFEHTQRTHAIYFSYMFQTEDQTKITLPVGWKVGNLPNEVHVDVKAAEYRIQSENKDNTLLVTRTLRSDIVLLQPSLYPALRDFYQKVRSGDEQQAVLQPGANSAAK